MLNQVVSEIIKLNYFKGLKSGFLLVFLALLIYRLLDQFFTVQIDFLVRSSDGLDSKLWVWAILSLISSMLFPLLVAVLCSYSLVFNRRRGLEVFLADHFEMTFLESLRSWGKAFLWGLVFIIPGLIKMSFYFLVPYVAMFSRGYKAGTIDALKLSEVISKKFWTKLNVYVTIFFLVYPFLISTGFDQYTLISKHPISALALIAVETAMMMLFNYLILKEFFKYTDYDTNDLNRNVNELKSQGDLHVTYV